MTELPWLPATLLSPPQMLSAAMRPCLFAGQRHEGVLARDRVAHLHGVAHGEHVGHGGLHALVHHDAALDARGKPRLARQVGVGGHADGHGHQVGGKGRLALDQHVHAAVLALLEAYDRPAQRQVHAVAAHLGVDERGHVGVEGAHEVRGPLYYRDLQPRLAQVAAHIDGGLPEDGVHLVGIHRLV